MRMSITLLFAGILVLFAPQAIAQQCPAGTVFQNGVCVVYQAQPAQPPPPPQQQQGGVVVQAQVGVGQPVYAQPVYAQPVYAQPVYQPVVQPVYMRGRRGRGEGRRHGGLIAGGAVMFGVSYISMLIADFVWLTLGSCYSCSGHSSTDTTLGYLGLIPLAGPFIDAVIVAGQYGSQPDGVVLLVLDGLLQVGGFAMLLGGARRRDPGYAENSPRHDRRPAWALMPGAGGAPAGLTFAMSHF